MFSLFIHCGYDLFFVNPLFCFYRLHRRRCAVEVIEPLFPQTDRLFTQSI
jgi:hypothetical protein